MVICWTPSIVCYLPFCSLREKEISDIGAYALSEALQVNHSLQELEWVQLPYSGYFWGEKFLQNHDPLYYGKFSWGKFLWTPFFLQFYPRGNSGSICKTAGPSPRCAWVQISICVGSRIVTVQYDFGDWFGWSSPSATVEIAKQQKFEFPIELMAEVALGIESWVSRSAWESSFSSYFQCHVAWLYCN